MDRKRIVKQHFENTSYYLKHDYNLRIRQEVVQGFIGGKKFEDALDIPSGNGAISLPLQEQFKHLTLVDISPNMMELARKSIPGSQKDNVTSIEGDAFELDLEANKYDLIISLGILAHISHPENFLKLLLHIARPGAVIIIQNTDARHFYSYFIRAYLFIKRIVKFQKYTLNKISGKDIEDFFRKNDFDLKSVYRYNQSFLGFSGLFSNTRKYDLTRKFFGDHENNKHAGWGSDCIYHFERKIK